MSIFPQMQGMFASGSTSDGAPSPLDAIAQHLDFVYTSSINTTTGEVRNCNCGEREREREREREKEKRKRE